MTTKTETQIKFYEIGRQAYLNGDPAAPIFNSTVVQAIDGLPVGSGAAEIMKSFSDGWMAANLADDSWNC